MDAVGMWRGPGKAVWQKHNDRHRLSSELNVDDGWITEENK